MKRVGLRPGLIVVLLLVLLAACGNGQSSSDEPSTTVATGDTAASDEVPDTTEPQEAADTTEPQELEEKSGSMRVAFSNWSLAYTPMAIAFDRLTEMGYEIEPIEVGTNANQLQAATQGEVDVTTIAQVIDAVDQGLDWKFFQGTVVNEYIMVSRKEFDTCESLDG